MLILTFAHCYPLSMSGCIRERKNVGVYCLRQQHRVCTLVVRSMGVSILNISLLKLRLSKTLLKKDSDLWETEKTWKIRLYDTRIYLTDRVNNSQIEIVLDYCLDYQPID